MSDSVFVPQVFQTDRRTSKQSPLDGQAVEEVRARFGWSKLGDQEPYWTVTGESFYWYGGRWHPGSSGCIHAEIARAFPQLAPSLRWHLSAYESGPMHYVANAKYHWQQYQMAVGLMDPALVPDYMRPKDGVSSEERLGYFKSHVVLGAIPGEQMPDTSADFDEVVKPWLEARLPELIKTMRAETAACVAALIESGAPIKPSRY